MKSVFSKINAWFHLWVGIVTGAIVFIVSITGAILVFEWELRDWAYPERRAEAPAGAKQLPPSVLIPAAEAVMPGMHVHGIQYHVPGHAAEVTFHSDSVVYVNPYTGKVNGIVHKHDFITWVEMGHVHLWLPHEVGTKIVLYSTLIFFFLLLTGLVLWWPKKWNRHNIRNAFSIKWTAKIKRVNYDLHNVLGFYTLPVTLIMAYTGMYMGLGWVQKPSYWLASGGKAMPEYYQPPSDTTNTHALPKWQVVDDVWRRSVNEYAAPKSAALLMGIPEDDERDASIYVYTNMEGAYYQGHYFDQYTGAKLEGGGVDVMPYDDANLGDKLRRMNYSLHVGLIWGIPSKIIYCIGALIAASLPITGFIIWWGKKKKQKRKKPANRPQQAVAS
ncbi:PepSY-associated TM helix domain-containing protein [Chitinophaga rhizosphaerae]|uniref:PepSY-associated TM helix domain-containing protein n=1 Tax=Chitinophaga rhizosphaerae TaxID=1864947 RepID=UPI000F81547C|nr:PepSY-associated TM helix domain-containing protein [Chitinophaga rhizosphaerae]